MGPGGAFGFVRQTYSEWSSDKASRLAAALAYYAMFAIAPLLVLVVLVMGLVFGTRTAQADIVDRLESVVGPGSAQLVGSMIEAAAQPTTGGILTTAFSFGALIFGATGFFVNLQNALNDIWGVQPSRGGGIVGTIRSQATSRLWGFALVVGAGILFIAALFASTYLTAAIGPLADILPGSSYVFYGLNVGVSFAMITVLLAAIYKVLPDAEISWRDVWVGAAATAVLLVLGQVGIGFYMARAGVGSIYGAAASLVVLLVWIYLFAQILLFGAEFTQVYARRYGRPIRPTRGAEAVNKGARAQQGRPQTVPTQQQGRQPQEQAEQEPRRREERVQPSRAGGLLDRFAPVLVGIAFGWMLGTTAHGKGKE